MQTRRRDLAAVLSYLVVAAVVLLVRVKNPLADALLTPLVLYVPGLAIISALESPRHRLEGPKRILLSVTMSFAAIVLGGLALNAIRLDQTTWAVWLFAVSVLGTTVAAIRDRATEGRISRSAAPSIVPHWPTLRRTTATLSLTVVCVACAVGLAEISARHSYDTPVTQIAALPVGGPTSVLERLSITNLSGSRRRYVVELSRLGGAPKRRLTISVAASQTWTKVEPRTRRVSIATVSATGESPRIIGEVTWTA